MDGFGGAGGQAALGKDAGENPYGTLIVAKGVPAATRKIVRDALLAPDSDSSAKAKKLRESLEVKKYIITTLDEFAHTIDAP